MRNGRLAGTRIRFSEARDEEEALAIHSTKKSIEFFDKRDKREEKRDAKARAKITLPKFSWDKKDD